MIGFSVIEYNIESAQDIQDALKDLLGGTIKEMMEAEMEDHLGYGKSQHFIIEDQLFLYFTEKVSQTRVE